MFSKIKLIRANKNSVVSTIIIYLLYLEKKYNSKFLSFLRSAVWQPTLCLNLKPSSFSLDSLLTLRLVHPYMIIINGGCNIGSNCTIYHDVTLGMIETKTDKCPQIGNNVYLGCKCSVLGDVTVGDNTMIGAHALVLKSTPPQFYRNWLI